MSMLNSVLRTTAKSAASQAVYSVTRSPSLAITTIRGVGTFATRHGNDPEVLERGKTKILEQHHPNSTVEIKWHEEVASDSEAFVKAIRSEVQHAEKDIEEMTKESEKILRPPKVEGEPKTKP